MHVDVTELAPCPKCRERKKLTTELHPGTAFAKCDACGFKGPEILPRGDELESLATVVRAWNNLPR